MSTRARLGGRGCWLGGRAGRRRRGRRWVRGRRRHDVARLGRHTQGRPPPHPPAPEARLHAHRGVVFASPFLHLRLEVDVQPRLELGGLGSEAVGLPHAPPHGRHMHEALVDLAQSPQHPVYVQLKEEDERGLRREIPEAPTRPNHELRNRAHRPPVLPHPSVLPRPPVRRRVGTDLRCPSRGNPGGGRALSRACVQLGRPRLVRGSVAATPAARSSRWSRRQPAAALNAPPPDCAHL